MTNQSAYLQKNRNKYVVRDRQLSRGPVEFYGPTGDYVHPSEVSEGFELAKSQLGALIPGIPRIMSYGRRAA